jgi:protein-L-isoaspartate(D-aspartate) O-methyltransferase
MGSSAALRRALVDELVRSDAVRSPGVRRAFLTVPRENFVPEIADTYGIRYVYTDQALIVQERDGVPTSSSSQPTVMAQMLEALDVRAGGRVLEIGLGTGYNAALLARLVGRTGRVTSLDIDEDRVHKATRLLESGGYPVSTAVADGRLGWPPAAPYDRIIVTASSKTVPQAWWSQLAADGVLVVPLRLDAMQIIAQCARTAEGFRTTRLIPGGFMPLRDAAAAVGEAAATITVRTSLPGHQTETLSVVGPGLSRLSAKSRRSLVGYLVDRPRRRRIPAYPAMPVIWHTALHSSPRRHIAAYLGTPCLRFGFVDPSSGAFSTLLAERVDDRFTTTAIESFGPDRQGPSDLVEHLRRWSAAGSPTIDRLTVEVSYGRSRLPARGAALRTIRHPDHTIRFRWS